MFAGRHAFKARLKSDCSNTFKAMRKHRTHYLFMLPYLLIFTLFTILPVVVAVCLSFTSFNMLSAPQFIGVSNYFRLFLNDDIFVIALKNTLAFAVIVGPGGFLLSFFFAWLINDLSRGMRVFFTIVFTHRLFPGAYLLSGIIFSAAMPGLYQQHASEAGGDTGAYPVLSKSSLYVSCFNRNYPMDESGNLFPCVHRGVPGRG